MGRRFGEAGVGDVCSGGGVSEEEQEAGGRSLLVLSVGPTETISDDASITSVEVIGLGCRNRDVWDDRIR